MEKYKQSYKNNKFKISATTSNKKFESPDGDFIGNKIADKITKVPRTSPQNSETEIPKERYISPEKNTPNY